MLPGEQVPIPVPACPRRDRVVELSTVGLVVGLYIQFGRAELDLFLSTAGKWAEAEREECQKSFLGRSLVRPLYKREG